MATTANDIGKKKPPQKPHSAVPQKCSGCGEAFASRNAIFRHLRDTDGACLSGADYEHFCKQIRSIKTVKVLILFGYMSAPGRIKNGDDAATIILEAAQQWQDGVDGTSHQKPSPSSSLEDAPGIRYNRAYGCVARGTAVAQDDDTGAITEVLATRLQPIRGNRTVDQWLDQVQEILNAKFPSSNTTTPCPVRILGRQDVPQANKFNAELDVSHRRVNYVLPVDFISWNTPEFQKRLETLPTFLENNKHLLSHNHDPEPNLTDEETRIYLFQLKRIMQSLTTQIVELDVHDKAAVMEKGFSLQKRKAVAKKSKEGKKAKKGEKENGSKPKDSAEESPVTEHHRILRRKRFHNFTPSMMAHEYLAYRRMDRFYHRATLSFPSLDLAKKPFIVLSITGDLLLTGQICRVVGLFIALANQLIDKEFVDCIFDEKYPHLIPTPPAPSCGMVASEASYMTWEGKLKSILSARSTDRYPAGWNQHSTLQRVKEWNDTIHEAMAKQWLAKGRDQENGRLSAEKEWTENILLPWVEEAKRHLDEYKQWRKYRTDQESETQPDTTVNPDALIDESKNSNTTILDQSLESVDPTVPEAFSKVLFHLRKVDESGQWPSTTLKRQLVMVSTADTEEAKQKAATSLSMAHVKARKNRATRSSAYSFTEGQGGASGSFSVGLMPGGQNKQPKSNFLFPDLVKAAFELERALFPDREPSSTIAINRNAQFRPHTDSGAGAGQSTSLIVGLGTYAGGELLVEGEKHDIRYKAIEFNGWKQRHWTMPFVGERYSLVWFTPKGCEGMRGIDLDLTVVPKDDASIDEGDDDSS